MGGKHSRRPNLTPYGKGGAMTVNSNNNRNYCGKASRITDSELQSVHL